MRIQAQTTFANESAVQRRKREMEVLEEMNRKKREWEEAQRKFAELQRLRYKNEGQDDWKWFDFFLSRKTASRHSARTSQSSYSNLQNQMASK